MPRKPRSQRPQSPQLTLDTRNANRGTTRGRQLLRDSLTKYGTGRSILIDREGRVIAGNKTFEQAGALGIPVQIVRSDGSAVVAVQRTDLDLETDPRARGLAIADNRVAELDLEWDPQILEQLRQEGLAIDTWWTPEEWTTMQGTPNARDATENAVLAPGPTTIQRGDVFALGQHIVGCGDATSPVDVARVCGGVRPTIMLTDPPYGVGHTPEWRHKAFPQQRTAVGRVTNDTQAAWPEAFAHFPGDVLYAWHAGIFAPVVAQTIQGAGFELRAQIIWVKQHFALSRGDYHWQHEPCWYAVRKGATAHWQGDRTQSTVWQVPNLNPMGGQRVDDNAPTGHSTQKPVQLFERPLLNHTTTGDAVYDPFVGSGTTVIAAEKLGRRALVMDIDPQYVQVTITRWERWTGRKATQTDGVRPGRSGFSVELRRSVRPCWFLRRRWKRTATVRLPTP